MRKRASWRRSNVRLKEKFPFASAAACKRLYQPLAFVSWDFSFGLLGFFLFSSLPCCCCGSVFHDVCTFAPCTLYRPILSYKAKISAIRANEKAGIPFACFIGVAFLLSEHQMGFVCRAPPPDICISVSPSVADSVSLAVCGFLLRNSSMVC